MLIARTGINALVVFATVLPILQSPNCRNLATLRLAFAVSIFADGSLVFGRYTLRATLQEPAMPEGK